MKKPEPDAQVQLVSAFYRGLESAPPMPLPMVPKIWIQGSLLCWKPREGDPPSRDLARLLVDFVALSTERDRGILEFARQWGPLGLCEKHGQPAAHLDRTLCPVRFSVTPPDPGDYDLARKVQETIEFAEPLSLWRQYAAHAHSVLALSAALNSGEKGDPLDWRVALGRQIAPEDDRAELLLRLVNLWLEFGKPHPVLAPAADGRYELRFTSGNLILSDLRELGTAGELILRSADLFALLAVQIASAVAGGSGLATCSACGVLYNPTRHPAQGRRHFCPNCGIKGAWRISKREARSASRSDTGMQAAKQRRKGEN